MAAIASDVFREDYQNDDVYANLALDSVVDYFLSAAGRLLNSTPRLLDARVLSSLTPMAMATIGLLWTASANDACNHGSIATQPLRAFFSMRATLMRALSPPILLLFMPWMISILNDS